MKMNKKAPIVIGVGELLWDIFPDGKKMGGAPANFIYHISNLGFKGYVVSAVGNDENGRELFVELKNKNIDTSYIETNNHPTGTVSVSLDSEGNPSYTIHENVAWDFIELNNNKLNLALSADAICFGSLAQRNNVTRHTIESFLFNTNPACIKVFDINLRQNYYSKQIIRNSLELADVLKVNEEELTIVGYMENIKNSEKYIMKKLLEKYELSLIALTKGDKSSIFYTKDEISILDTPKVQVVDTVGAGDSFTATLVAGLLKNMQIKEIHRQAADISAWVCTQAGATPEYN